MFKTMKQRQKELRDVERAVYSAMETGNEDQARTLYIEYREINYAAAQYIRGCVQLDYRIDL